MAREIEAKYRLSDPEGLRRRLRACGARREGAVLETNRYFDRGDGGLMREDRGLRIRVAEPTEGSPAAAPKATLTYKGPRERGELKIRREIELGIDDAGAAAALLEGLGFTCTLGFQKRRETWRLEPCEVVLDELPALGHFVEIEGPSEAAVLAAAGRLGLEGQPLERTPYSTLMAQYRQEAGLGTETITF